MGKTNLKSSCQELVLDLQEVSFALLRYKWFVDDLETLVVLDILPTSIAMTGEFRLKEKGTFGQGLFNREERYSPALQGNRNRPISSILLTKAEVDGNDIQVINLI